jgi:DNA helicase-2/ATP-dependent DNA helicase PcrA
MIENRVYGPPGSGKTYKIVKEILPACIDKYGQAGIIVISYTRTAASEIINRLGGKAQTFGVGDMGLDACDNVGGKVAKIKAGTLHSLCFHALGMPEIASGKTVMDLFCREYASAKSLIGGGGGGRLERISMLRNKMVGIDQIDEGGLKTLWRLWEEFKTRNELMDFTDLIEKSFDRIEAPGSPLCIIADEAQDLTPLQIKLLRWWNRHLKELYLICDDDQSIFSFIGADPNELIRMDLGAETEIRTEILKVSRRLPVEIHKYAKKYIEKIDKRKKKEFLSNGLGGKVVNIGCAMGSDRMMKIMLDEARDREVMVLASCDYMLNDVIDKMKERGVRFSNRYKTDDNRWNPVSEKIWRVIECMLRTQTAGDLCEWVEYIDDGFIIKKEPECDTTDKVVACGESKKKEKKKRLVINDIERENLYREYLRNVLIDSEFDLFEDIWDEERGEDRYFDRMSWFMRRINIKYFKKFEYAYKILCGEYKDLKEITIGTIHSAKGRECPVVFVCPDKSPATIKDSKFDKSAIIRLFYVAMTRASEKLFFCMPSVGKDGVIFK